MVVTVRQQYFQLRAPLCNEALGTSCLLADEGVQVGFCPSGDCLPLKSLPLLSEMSGPPNPNKVSVKPLLLSTISPTPQRLKDDVSF